MGLITINVQIDVIRGSSDNIYPFDKCHALETLKTQ